MQEESLGSGKRPHVCSSCPPSVCACVCVCLCSGLFLQGWQEYRCMCVFFLFLGVLLSWMWAALATCV